ncbi:Dcp1p-Dcp2p decapping enzyme complex alpha subunit [Allomyces javanicus]|nr:Dcp1p-Dcp2p decapping enzyme complex alpha subunit [Allomyces javanicus]
MDPALTMPGERVLGPYLDILRQQVADLLRVRHKRFAGAQPVSFTKEHLDALENRNFFVCEKTDGLRMLLYTTFNERLSKYETFLIDRKNEFYFTKILLPLPLEATKSKKPFVEFHRCTLLDGELILDTEPNGQKILRYLVFDCLVCIGKTVIDRPFRVRLGHFHKFVLEPLKEMVVKRKDLAARIPFLIEAKEMQLSYHVKEIFDSIPFLKHKSDGLIFTSSEEPYTLGTDPNILKWKPADENSVDFMLRIRNDQFELHLWEGQDRHRFQAYLEVENQQLHDLLSRSNGKIIECNWDPEHQRWQYMRFREDKNTANHTDVYRKILHSIQDGVTREELEADAPVIKSNWKMREATGTVTPAPSYSGGSNGHATAPVRDPAYSSFASSLNGPSAAPVRDPAYSSFASSSSGYSNAPGPFSSGYANTRHNDAPTGAGSSSYDDAQRYDDDAPHADSSEHVDHPYHQNGGEVGGHDDLDEDDDDLARDLEDALGDDEHDEPVVGNGAHRPGPRDGDVEELDYGEY